MFTKVLKKISKNEKNIEGHVDFVSGRSISGWFMDAKNGRSLKLGLYIGKKLLKEISIDVYRSDLNVIGKLNPKSGFTIELDENIDFSIINEYLIYINGKFSKYATNELRKTIRQLILSSVNNKDDIPQLKEDREWLLKIKGENEREISYLKECEQLLSNILNQDPEIKSRFGSLYLNARDQKEISDLISLDIAYDEKKAGFSYIASNILQRDLAGGGVDLKFESKADPKVSIILVLYNKAELTYQCLKSIKSETSLDFELIIIDNDSSDETEELMSQVEGITYIRNEDNVGFLKACNQARQYVNSDYILLLNNDALLHNGTLKAGIDVFSKDKDIGVVGGKILHLDGMLQEAGSIIWSDASCLGYGRRESPDLYKYTYRHEVDYVSGALFFTPTKVWDEMNGFDERLAPCYYEETDFCIRVAKRGMKILMEPKCQITHFEFGSSNYSDFAVKQMQKNMIVIQDIHSEYLSNKLPPKPENIQIAARPSNRKTVLYMDDQVPFDMLGAGFPRAKDVISEVSKTANVIVYPFCENSDWGDLNDYNDIMLLPFNEYEAIEYINSIISTIDAVWVSRPHNMEKLIQRNWLEIFKVQNIPIVYDAEALFSEREKLRCEIKGLQYDTSIEDKEFELIESADYVVAVSEAEKIKLNNKIDKDVFVIGHPCENHDLVKSVNRNILFVGNLMGCALESPNVDSIDYFLDLYRDVLVENNITLTLVGKIDDDNRTRWETDFVVVKGCVDSLNEEFENAICTIAPTRFAAGIPHKIHESLSWSTPVLATALILKQCGFEIKESGGLLSESSLVKICNDEVFQKKLLRSQQESAKTDMSINVMKNTISSILDATLS